MRFQRTAAVLAASASMVSAQRPSSTPICDYYTTALLKNNTAANQYTLLTLLVNTVVIGNYTQPNVGVVVPGILAPGTYNGTAVNLLPYFNGALASTNMGGSSGVSVNFLDGGGAAPLQKNMPANDTTSNQYFLLTHLYQFFGALLGCSQYGMGAFPSYGGDTSMYSVHQYMDLDAYEVGYFIQQVGLAAASFGVTTADITIAANALVSLFDYRCTPPTAVLPKAQPELQAICINNSSCPIAPTGATCNAYAPAMMPKAANATMSSSSGSASTTGAATTTTTGKSSATSPLTVPTAGAAMQGVNLAAVVGGVVALLL